MQTAFFFRLIFPPPAAGPKVFTFLYRPCARHTANAWEAPVMQGIVRYIILFNIGLYLVKRPIKNRVELHQLVYLIPFCILHKLAIGRLLCTYTGYPAFIAF